MNSVLPAGFQHYSFFNITTASFHSHRYQLESTSVAPDLLWSHTQHMAVVLLSTISQHSCLSARLPPFLSSFTNTDAPALELITVKPEPEYKQTERNNKETYVGINLCSFLLLWVIIIGYCGHDNMKAALRRLIHLLSSFLWERKT